ncbi:putative protein UXT -like protein [Capsicum annuum]|nr:putative protein UXT -like protein [Capsicum annuum]
MTNESPPMENLSPDPPDIMNPDANTTISSIINHDNTPNYLYALVKIVPSVNGEAATLPNPQPLISTENKAYHHDDKIEELSNPSHIILSDSDRERIYKPWAYSNEVIMDLSTSTQNYETTPSCKRTIVPIHHHCTQVTSPPNTTMVSHNNNVGGLLFLSNQPSADPLNLHKSSISADMDTPISTQTISQNSPFPLTTPSPQKNNTHVELLDLEETGTTKYPTINTFNIQGKYGNNGAGDGEPAFNPSQLLSFVISVVEVPAVGNVGELAILWDDSILGLSDVATTDQEIHTIMKIRALNDTWLFSSIYASFSASINVNSFFEAEALALLMGLHMAAKNNYTQLLGSTTEYGNLQVLYEDRSANVATDILIFGIRLLGFAVMTFVGNGEEEGIVMVVPAPLLGLERKDSKGDYVKLCGNNLEENNKEFAKGCIGASFSGISGYGVINNSMEVDEELPRVLSWNKDELYQWEGFWATPSIIKAAMIFKETFKSNPNDVLLASSMKTGSTWLKSICVCIMQGGNKDEEDLLFKDNPHFYVPTIEGMDYYTKPLAHDLYTMSSPRLFHTHLPYRILPNSIKNSANCKIVYITRNPKDTIISMWHFFNYNHKYLENFFPLEEAVDSYCNGGIHLYGPFFEHVLEYWEESKKWPQKILFLKYEDLKMDPKKEVAKIAFFLGKPFGNEEDLEKVLKKCSLERLKNLEVNKSGSLFSNVHNNSFFRKGVVGDWKNHLTPEMEKQIDKVTSLKLQGSGLEL